MIDLVRRLLCGSCCCQCGARRKKLVALPAAEWSSTTLTYVANGSTVVIDANEVHYIAGKVGYSVVYLGEGEHQSSFFIADTPENISLRVYGRRVRTK